MNPRPPGLLSPLSAILLLVLSPGIVPHAGTSQTAEFSTEVPALVQHFRVTYLAEARAILQKARATDAQWLSQYSEAVSRYARESQARGDFDAWQAGNRELRRFEDSRSVTAADLVASPEQLRALQQRAIEARIEVRRKAARETVDLTDRLAARLETLKRERTIRGDAAGAQLAVDAIAQARADEIYSDALFSLDTNDPFPAPATLPPDSSRNLATAPDASAPPAGRVRRTEPATIPTSPGVRISAPDVAPPQAPGTRLSILTETEAFDPGTSPVTVSARYLARDNLRFRLEGQEYTANVMDIQVAIKASAAAERVDGLIIVAEYFVGRSRGDPFPVQFAAVNLAAVDTRTLYIQMPPTSYQIQTVPSAIGGTRRVYDRTLQFKGYVVTVFDTFGNILQQSVSDRGLLPFAGDVTRYNPDGTLNYP